MKLSTAPSSVATPSQSSIDDRSVNPVSQVGALSDAMRVEIFKSIGARRIERYQAQLIEKQESARLEREKVMAVWRAVLDYAQIGLKTVIIVNGAGVGGILAFLGNVYKPISSVQILNSGSTTPNVFLLSISVGVFACGVTLGFMATLFAYFNQYRVVWAAIENEKPVSRQGRAFTRMAGVTCAILGIPIFGLGVALAVCAFVRPYVP